MSVCHRQSCPTILKPMAMPTFLPSIVKDCSSIIIRWHVLQNFLVIIHASRPKKKCIEWNVSSSSCMASSGKELLAGSDSHFLLSWNIPYWYKRLQRLLTSVCLFSFIFKTSNSFYLCRQDVDCHFQFEADHFVHLFSFFILFNSFPFSLSLFKKIVLIFENFLVFFLSFLFKKSFLFSFFPYFSF